MRMLSARGALRLAGVLAGLCAPGLAIAQDATAPQLGPIALAAAQRGVKTCLGAIERVTSAISRDRQVGAYFFNAIEGANDNLISISLGALPSPSGQPLYVSLTFAPSGERCQATVESTMAWTVNCTQASLTFREYRISGRLTPEIQMLETDGPARLFVIPNGEGCITIEKAVIF